jgi:hypothetical protein
MDTPIQTNGRDRDGRWGILPYEATSRENAAVRLVLPPTTGVLELVLHPRLRCSHDAGHPEEGTSIQSPKISDVSSVIGVLPPARQQRFVRRISSAEAAYYSRLQKHSRFCDGSKTVAFALQNSRGRQGSLPRARPRHRSSSSPSWTKNCAENLDTRVAREQGHLEPSTI